MKFFHKKNQGFSILEVIIVLVLMGILSLAGGRSADSMDQARRFRQTLDAMERIRFKLSGNPSVLQNGHRVDYGYLRVSSLLPFNVLTLIDLPSSHPDITTQDYWGNAYTINSPYGNGTNITMTSLGANGAAGGSGFDTDLAFQINVQDHYDSDTRVYLTDRNGTALTNAHISAIQGSYSVDGGITADFTYQNAGYWSKNGGEPGIPGPMRIQVDVDAAYDTELGGPDMTVKASPRFMTWAYVYPNNSFARNKSNIFEVRLPGRLTAP